MTKKPGVLLSMCV